MTANKKEDKSMKSFTTGDIAKIFNVAPRTVSKWADSGKLECYKLPGSKHRRVTKASLDKFAKENDLPFDLTVNADDLPVEEAVVA